MNDWLNLFYDQVMATGLWQWVAVVFGVTEVLLAKKNNVWLYPAGIISTLIAIFLLADVKLYAESFLNGYYLVMSIYGWYYWLKKPNKAPVKISYASRSDWMITLAISLGGWLLLFLILKNFTPSDVPVLDALVSSTAWAGMWLLAKRKMENWILLNISNLVAIPLLYHKNLPMFSVLTIVLFVVAIFGYIEWRKIFLADQAKKISAFLL